MKDVAKIVEELVNSIDCKVTGKLDEITGSILTCHTKWMRVGKSVWNADGDEYRVTEIDRDISFKAVPLIPTAPALDGIITLQAPFWISGTQIATNNEWSKASSNLLLKTPITWLLETLRMTKFGYGDTRDFETDIRLFFLDETDIVNYYTADHREQVVVPMSELANAFIEVVKSNPKFETLTEYDMITFSRFGVERNDGMFKNILDANLSGLELKVTLVKYKENCKC